MIEMLAESLQRSHTVTDLSMRSNRHDSNGEGNEFDSGNDVWMEKLAHGLAVNKSIITLRLNALQIGPRGLEILAGALHPFLDSHRHQLNGLSFDQSLSFDSSDIFDPPMAGMSSMRMVPPHNATLTALDLSHNPLNCAQYHYKNSNISASTGAGVTLGNLLQRNTSLTWLKLWHCGLGDQGLRPIAR